MVCIWVVYKSQIQMQAAIFSEFTVSVSSLAFLRIFLIKQHKNSCATMKIGALWYLPLQEKEVVAVETVVKVNHQGNVSGSRICIAYVY